MSNAEIVRQVAYQARGEFASGVVYATRKNLLIRLYNDYLTRNAYASGFDTKLFVERASELFPESNCGLTSVYIQYLLRGEGQVTHGSYDGEGHTVWHIGGILLADITGDQFGGPEVYVGPAIEPWSLEPPDPMHVSPSKPGILDMSVIIST